MLLCTYHNVQTQFFKRYTQNLCHRIVSHRSIPGPNKAHTTRAHTKLIEILTDSQLIAQVGMIVYHTKRSPVTCVEPEAVTLSDPAGATLTLLGAGLAHPHFLQRAHATRLHVPVYRACARRARKHTSQRYVLGYTRFELHVHILAKRHVKHFYTTIYARVL